MKRVDCGLPKAGGHGTDRSPNFTVPCSHVFPPGFTSVPENEARRVTRDGRLRRSIRKRRRAPGQRRVTWLHRFDLVPEISRFFGIVVRMYYDDHSPPHFHATYGSFKVVVGLSDLAILKGGLPPRALGLLMEWAVQHRDELAENWRLAAAMKPLKPIAPLE